MPEQSANHGGWILTLEEKEDVQNESGAAKVLELVAAEVATMKEIVREARAKVEVLERVRVDLTRQLGERDDLIRKVLVVLGVSDSLVAAAVVQSAKLPPPLKLTIPEPPPPPLAAIAQEQENARRLQAQAQKIIDGVRAFVSNGAKEPDG